MHYHSPFAEVHMTQGQAVWARVHEAIEQEHLLAQPSRSEQMVFNLAAMGLVHCPSCNKIIEQVELHHLGECFDCFRASIEN